MKNEIEILRGLRVVDEQRYARYRELMTPLLEAHGGRFVLDVRVAEVLRSPGSVPMNRLFTIRFPSQERHDAFFAHPDYQAVRREWFEPSVAGVERLGDYEVSA